MTDLASLPEGLLGVEDWDALELSESRHWELVEGNVVMTPRPTFFHSGAGIELCVLLRSHASNTSKVVADSEVVIDSRTPATVRAPDVMLVSRAAYATNPTRVGPADVSLVVEIVSPGSRRIDYVAKRYDYEQAGIPFYWIIDLEDRVAHCFQLTAGIYSELAVSQNDLVIMPAPVPIEFTWDQLIGLE